MEVCFNHIIDSVLGAPYMIYVSLAIALAFVIGGVILYVKHEKIKGWRWPGVTCALLGCATPVTTAAQYIF